MLACVMCGLLGNEGIDLGSGCQRSWQETELKNYELQRSWREIEIKGHKLEWKDLHGRH